MSTHAAAKKPKNPGSKRSGKGTTVGRGTPNAARVRSAAKPGNPPSEEPHSLRKRPLQRRSIEMVEAILQAAAEVFARLGYARTTTNKIAQRAGVSVGSLYQYFPNKDSLLVSLMQQHHVDVHRVVDRALTRLADPTQDLEDCLRQLLADLVEVHQANPELTRALAPAVLRESPAIETIQKNEPDAGSAHRIIAVLAARPDVRDGDHLAMAAVLGQTTSQLTRWLVHDAPPQVAPDALADEILQLLYRYLKRP